MSVTAAAGDEGRKTLQDELDEVRSDLIRLGALTTEAIAAGTQAFLDGDLHMAEAVVEADDVIDDLYHQIEDHLLLILATQSPVAADLRAVVTMLRINHELERDADLMVNVAKTTRRIYPHELDPKVRGIIDRMGVQASNQTRLAIDAFADSRPVMGRRARATWTTRWTSSRKSLFRHILTWGDVRRGHDAAGGAGRAGRPALRADRRPRGDDRRAGAVHGHRPAPRRGRRRST